MNTNVKRTLLTATVACLLLAAVVLTVLFGLNGNNAVAADDEGMGYYYSGLRDSALAKKFYGVLKDMAEKGQYKTGTTVYDLTGVLTETEIKEYVDAQSAKLPVAFGAARDTFYFDNPDLFYVDFYKLTVSAGTQDGEYVAFVSSGRAESFLDSDFPTEDAVNAAIAEYEAALNKVVNEAKAECGDDVVQLIKYANKALQDIVDYDYGARENSLSGKAYDNYVNTAYGALVKGKAMCGGYSSAFKAVMDRLNIPCVLILGNGYAKAQGAQEAGFEAHMWNAVQVDGLWYGVDVTWNDDTGAPEKYLLAGNDLMSKEHYVDPVVSTSGYEMNYPVLRPFGYGVSEDASGFNFKDSGYLIKDETKADTEDNRQYMGYSDDETEPSRKIFDMGVQYQGKDHKKLAEEGKYLCVRFIYEEGTDVVSYTGWLNMHAYDELGYATGFEDPMYPVYQNYSYIYFNWSVYQFQFAVIDLEPTEENMLNGSYYKGDATDNILAMSVVYGNDAYGTFNPAPTITQKIPESSSVASFEPMDVTFVYSEALQKIDETQDVGIKMIAKHADIEDYAAIENIQFDGNRTVTFRFYPSQSFSHSQEVYTFTLLNLQGKGSEKKPESVTYVFERQQVICPKVFNDGRMYMKVFGEPLLLGAENLALNDFKDKNGQPVAGNQRSQLMLVVNKPNRAEEKQMEETLYEQTDLAQDDVMASETYQIDIHMCRNIQTIKTGSYMQIGFGFPKGYGPEDEGVTFTVYHYNRDKDGKITSVEEVPCVITQSGIIATVKSFSPFMICAVDSSKVAAKKNIYASVNGVGGSLDNTEIQTVGNDGITYNVTAESGYKVNRITLNGSDVTDKLDSDKITLANADLKDGSNELEVTFIAERVAEYYEEQGITVAEPQFVITAEFVEQVMTADKTPEIKPGDDAQPADKPKDKAMIIGLAVGIPAAVLVIAGAVVAVVLLKKKKKGEKKEENK